MATIAELKELALHAVRGTAPANFDCENVNDALRGELRNMVQSVNDFMRYKYDIYDILVEAVDEILPKNVQDTVGIFAEVRTVAQGDRVRFSVKNLGKERARQFLTQVGLSGVYESFRLDHKWFEVSMKAEGIACTIDFERLLDGADSLVDLIEIASDAMENGVFQEIQQALQAAVKDQATAAALFPANNFVISNGFNAAQMQKLVATAKAYGPSVAIFATPEFVAAMGPDAIVPGTNNYAGIYAPADIESIHNSGYITMFRGTPVIQLPQSFQNEKNTSTWIDPQLAYVLPAGQDKAVKVVIEGNTQMWDFTNADQSMEIHMYRKIGVGIMYYHNWCIYKNTGITQTYVAPYENI